MHQDEIIRMAQTCGFSREDHHAIYGMLARFAELVAAATIALLKSKERYTRTGRIGRVARAKRLLRGKDLLCWCAPRRCHGEVLLRIANEE